MNINDFKTLIISSLMLFNTLLYQESIKPVESWNNWIIYGFLSLSLLSMGIYLYIIHKNMNVNDIKTLMVAAWIFFTGLLYREITTKSMGNWNQGVISGFISLTIIVIIIVYAIKYKKIE